MKNSESRYQTEPMLASGASEFEQDLPSPQLRLGRIALEDGINNTATVDDIIDSYIEAGLIVKLD